MRPVPDLEALAERCYDAVGDDAAWHAWLSALRDRFRAGSVALIGHDFATGRGEWRLTLGFDPVLAGAYAERWAAENPWLACPDRYVAGRALLGAALVPEHRLVRTAFFADYLRPLGLFHRLAGTVLRRADTVVYLTLHRPPGSAGFEAEDLRALEWLLPHLARAARLHRDLLARWLAGADARLLLDRIPHALFLLDRGLRPVVMNAHAERLVREATALSIQGGRLSATGTAADLALRRTVRAVLDDPRPGASGGVELPLPRRDDPRPIAVRVSRLGARCPFADARDGRLAALVAIDPEPVAADPSTLVARLWGLTPAEARLCCLLAQGLRPAEAAERLGVSRNTVHSQLRQIFAKAGVHRQAELLRRLERVGTLG
ncbi:MAG: LuxR C-terminal-related transcriptional regulator [Geminicoccaceae bacterium]|nr:LuxR C-terminal-related transcriptional regulator [Geminicoccaceae bacterium]MCX8101680.1 LuxR C-terminal-related transcriptional regulator [Geminicoccaceae bacterium]MDW8371391.1 helix-turn-helix transcriptional regulator [Geminicoccaceae bacterium]